MHKDLFSYELLARRFFAIINTSLTAHSSKHQAMKKIGIIAIIFCQTMVLIGQDPVDTLSQVEEEFFEEDQFDEFSETEEEIIQQTEFVIPSSPAFALMGVTPEQVIRPGVSRNFKVDWRVRDYQVAPDLALEAQPFWLLFFQNKGLNHYRSAPGWLKSLSTLSFSGGTSNIDGINHFAFAFKFNLLSQRDPLQDRQFVKQLEAERIQEKDSLILEIKVAERQMRRTKLRESRRALRRDLAALRYELRQLNKAEEERLREARQEYMADNWNTSVLDIAFGQVYTYASLNFDSTNFNNAGWGTWINAAQGLGRHGLLSGIIKLTRVGGQNDVMLGSSYRHGSEQFNFFTELIFERRAVGTTLGGEDAEFFEENFDPDLQAAFVEFEDAQDASFWNLNFGGDFKLSRSILLNFSLRTRFDEGFRFSRITPIANIICLMR